VTEAAGASRGRVWPREFAHLRGAAAGPMLVTIGGIHGNEPAGLLATERVIAALGTGGASGLAAGDWVAFAGNRAALALGARYLDRDLNRGWSDDALARLSCDAPEARDASAEDDEQRALWAALDAAFAAARGPLHVIDLHTTSADGYPFAVSADAGPARAFALAFGVPIFLGLIERLEGALVPFLAQRGAIGVALEAGQNESADSVDRHAAALWIALAELGLVARDGAHAARVADARALLTAARADLPRAIEIVSRHALTRGDGFRMEPGFANIQFVRAGTLLAHDKGGEIRAREDAIVVMPLYQGQGEDGFFLGRAVAGQ
jgi:predicted deacylase